jgi:cytochrome b
MNDDTDRHAKSWDPLVKLTHWGIALAILVNGVVTEEGSDWHIWVGTAAAALLAMRLLWGLIGPAGARFSAFPPSPSKAIAHVGDIAAGRHTPHRSHNPLGALMAYALWATLAVVVGTGLAMTGLPGTGPAASTAAPALAEAAPNAEYGEEDEDEGDEAEGNRASGEGGEGDEWLEEVHEVAANLLFLLAALHVAGVVFETRRSGRQVLQRMTAGRDG